MKQRVQQEYQARTRPCLVKNGIDAPESVEAGSDKASALEDQAADLVSQGKCS
jgi:hypothetical protein